MAVYLIHFSEAIGDTSNPRGQAQHYVGYTNGEIVETRLEAHKRGYGARITAAAVDAGLELHLARVWEDGDRELERQIKRQKNHKRFCPLCNESGGKQWRLTTSCSNWQRNCRQTTSRR